MREIGEMRAEDGREGPVSMTVGGLCEEWLRSVKPMVKPSTYACYLTMVEKHIRGELGKVQAADLTNQMIMDFIHSRQKQGLSAGTVRLLLFLLKSIVQAGEEMGACPGETLYLKLPRQAGKRKEIMEWEDFHKMVSYLLNSRKSFELGLLISLGTGIRVGELCGMRWEDIDLDTGVLKVRRTVSRIRNVEEAQAAVPGGKTILQIGTPKTGSSVRDIPLPGFLTERLRERFCERRFSPQTYVLTGSGRVMEPRSVQRRFKNLLRRCGIKPVSVHSLRHSFASKWIEQGLDSKALSEILGHSSVKITMDIYVHSTMNQKKNYMDHVLEGIVIDQRSSL